MQRRAILVALALLMPAPDQSAARIAPIAVEHLILLQIYPSTDPDTVISCALNFEGRKVSAISAKGMGLIGLRVYRWWASSAEDQAMIDSLAGFLTEEIPSQNPLDLPRLQPPYLTVDWIAKLNGGLASGRYQQQGTTLPARLRHLFTTVMPASPCAAAPQS